LIRILNNISNPCLIIKGVGIILKNLKLKSAGVFILLISLAFVFASGCSSSSSDSAERIPAGQSDLQSAVWNLEYYVTEEGPVYVPDGVEVDLESINPNLISGSAGCNGYSSAYFLDEGNISIEDTLVTSMACLDERRMETEHSFLERLNNVSRTYILDGKLVFADPDYNEMLVFVDSGRDPENFHPGQMANQDDVAGHTWYLCPNIDENSLRGFSGNISVTLTFNQDGVLSGYSGCKKYSADYSLEKGRLTIGEIETEGDICPAGEGLETEYMYLDKLKLINGAYVDRNNLYLLNGLGVESLTFEKRSPESTEWSLISYYDEEDGILSVPADTEITLKLEDGQAGGNAGCNSFFTNYETDGNGSLTFGMIGMTEMYCEEKMDLESRYLSLLETTAEYSTAGGNLKLMNSEGNTIMIFLELPVDEESE
jgi:heat shock protein HslJ